MTHAHSAGGPGPRPWRIGVAANLDPGGSVHRPAFERGVELALAAWPHRDGIALHRASDGADPQRARDVARRFVAEGVDVVVGHFSSAAAAAAAPVYEQAGIPLLLPAATATALTVHTTTFRVCGHDAALAEACAQDLAERHGVHGLCLADDGSPHAGRMRRHLADALQAPRPGGPRVRHEPVLAWADALLFVGSFEAAVQALSAAPDRLPPRVFLSDDCVHPALAQRLPRRLLQDGRSVHVHGFSGLTEAPPERALADRCRRAFGEPPGIYFAETYSAMQMALRMAQLPAGGLGAPGLLATHPWDTVLGRLRFIGRESSRHRFALWRVEGESLRMVRTLPGPGVPAAPAALRQAEPAG